MMHFAASTQAICGLEYLQPAKIMASPASHPEVVVQYQLQYPRQVPMIQWCSLEQHDAVSFKASQTLSWPMLMLFHGHISTQLLCKWNWFMIPGNERTFHHQY